MPHTEFGVPVGVQGGIGTLPDGRQQHGAQARRGSSDYQQENQAQYVLQQYNYLPEFR
jgi:hypothetical protein